MIMNILLEAVIIVILIILMLKFMHLLNNDKIKVGTILIISVIINYIIFSMNPFENIWGKVIYYLINILIFTGLCKDTKEGLFYSISFYTIQSIISIIGLYINLYVTMQLYQIMAYLTIAISAALLIMAKRINIVNYNENFKLLYFINIISLCIAISFNYYISVNYQLMPDIYYIGFIILGVWIVLNLVLNIRIKQLL